MMNQNEFQWLMLRFMEATLHIEIAGPWAKGGEAKAEKVLADVRAAMNYANPSELGHDVGGVPERKESR